MTADVLTRTDTLDRDEWLEARRKGIGGSDAAAILGLDPWRTPLAVYLDKRGELPDDDSEAAEWGRRLEAFVADGAVDRINHDRAAAGLPPVKARRRHAILQHPDHPFMLASLDREIVGHERGPGVMEVKTTGYWAARQWDHGSDPDLPEQWHVQHQHYLAVTGRTHGWLAVLVAGQRLLVEQVERDDELIGALVEVEAAFWRRVQAGEPPPASARDDDVTKTAYARATPGRSVVLPAEARDLIEQRQAARAAESAAADRRKEAEARLRQLIGDAEVAFLPGDDRPCFTYKRFAPEKFNAKAFKAANPNLYEQFKRESPYRRFHFPEER